LWIITVETANSTSYWFRDGQGSRRFGQPVKKEQKQEDADPVEAIYCRVCGRVVTSRDRKIAVQGAHTHAFFNPAGIVFEVGCYSRAPGCQRAGVVTSDFTWFAGYVWRYALCRQCKSHLGWFFASAGHSFYALILANLIE
jgi:hypothetical protein